MPPRKARCRVQRLVLAAYETSPAWDPQQMSQVGGICGGMQSTSHTATGTVTANVCPSQGTHSLQVYPALESLRGCACQHLCTRIVRASPGPLSCLPVSLEALKGAAVFRISARSRSRQRGKYLQLWSSSPKVGRGLAGMRVHIAHRVDGAGCGLAVPVPRG
jgi:hypothetical protein